MPSGITDVSFAYGLRSDYVVQTDGIVPSDRVDIVSLPAAGDTIFATGTLAVFFRGSSQDTYGQIGIFNPANAETQVVAADGIPGLTVGTWHNFAVEFNQTADYLNIYVDQTLEAHVNLLTFDGGAYATFSKGAVGTGGANNPNSGNIFLDNFQVGAPVPEPSTLILFGLGSLGLYGAGRRRNKSAK